MKKRLFCAAVALQAMAGYGQLGQYTAYPRGPLCDDTTISRLKHFADSLNLQFRHYDLSKKYYSAEEGIANTILLKVNQQAALDDILQGISYADFVLKYPSADTATNLLLTKTHEKYSPGCSKLYYWIQRPDEPYPAYIYLPSPDHCDKWAGMYGNSGIKGNWVFNYHPPHAGIPGALTAFYITRVPESKPIPDEYAKMMLYADCMLDTTTEIFYPTVWSTDGMLKQGAKVFAFETYLKQETDRFLTLPPFHRINTRDDLKQYWHMDSLRKVFVRDSLSRRPEFKRLLSGAAEEAVSEKTETGDDFEFCVATWYSKSAALALKRNRNVSNKCGLSNEAGIHICNIAVLAAQSANWPVFLRARLRTLNDHAYRDAAESYGRSSQKVYVGDLENLGIHVPDFMLGVSLYTANAAENHYSGSVGMLGQAFAETKYREALGEKMLHMMMDNRLDDYNRLLMRYLYLKYVFFLPDKEERLTCLQKLEQADKTLPSCIAPRVKPDKNLFEQGIAGP